MSLPYQPSPIFLTPEVNKMSGIIPGGPIPPQPDTVDASQLAALGKQALRETAGDAIIEEQAEPQVREMAFFGLGRKFVLLAVTILGILGATWAARFLGRLGEEQTVELSIACLGASVAYAGVNAYLSGIAQKMGIGKP